MAFTLPLKIDENVLGLLDLGELERLHRAVTSAYGDKCRREAPKYKVEVSCDDRTMARMVASALVHGIFPRSLGQPSSGSPGNPVSAGLCVVDDVKVIYESANSPNCWKHDDVEELISWDGDD